MQTESKEQKNEIVTEEDEILRQLTVSSNKETARPSGVCMKAEKNSVSLRPLLPLPFYTELSVTT
jgi:hypothetical protein